MCKRVYAGLIKKTKVVSPTRSPEAATLKCPGIRSSAFPVLRTDTQGIFALHSLTAVESEKRASPVCWHTTPEMQRSGSRDTLERQ